MEETLQRLRKTFLVELEERVTALNRDLLALEKDPAQPVGGPLLSSVYRSVHGLKGAANSVGATPIEIICHRLEDIVAAVRDDRLKLGAELLQLFFLSIDAIQEAGSRLSVQQDLSMGSIAALLPQLERASSGKLVQPPPALQKPVLPVRPSPRPAQPDVSVRLAADKLDALLSRSGELLLARGRIEARRSDLDALRELVGHLRMEWLAAKNASACASGENGAGELASAGGTDVPCGQKPASRVAATENLQRVQIALERFSELFAADQKTLSQAVGGLDQEIRKVRMLPFAEACESLDRTIRDLARASGKEARLVVEGGDVEIDRSIADGLRDPLLHLARNAVDHGIEPAQSRLAAGKPAAGTITVSAHLHGDGLEVVFEDDGRGLDIDAIRRQASRSNLISGDDDELAQHIFRLGLSTAPSVTQFSGRGVGLNVVRTAAEAMRGSVTVSSTPGAGVRFVLRLPLTLTMLHAVLVRAGSETLAIDAASIVATLRVDPDDLRSIDGREVLMMGETPVAIVRLSEILGLAGPKPGERDRLLPAVVLRAGSRQAAFVVDEVLEERELVVRSAGPRLKRVRNVSAVAILPTGRIAILLDTGDLVATALAKNPASAASVFPPSQAVESRKCILLVDDSMTTRALEKSILEIAGYSVITAADGNEAIKLLEENRVNLVISDVEMPNMDGFTLTETIRLSPRLRHLPVVLVTGLSQPQNRERGLEAGANAYFVKSAFDQQQLLEVVTQHI